MKAYTDLEQSKKLAEILPLESADMYYNLGESNIPNFIHGSHSDFKCYIMCWSLAALISVLPDTITNNGGIAFKLNIKKNTIEYSNPSLYLIHKFVKTDNLIDACVEMIIKLNELKNVVKL